MRELLPYFAVMPDHLGQYADKELEAELAGCAGSTVVISTVDPQISIQSVSSFVARSAS